MFVYFWLKPYKELLMNHKLNYIILRGIEKFVSYYILTIYILFRISETTVLNR